jgi:site-specific DNA recombinase
MTITQNRPGDDLLVGWTDDQRVTPARSSGARTRIAEGGLRFAFYGRISTEDFQDPTSSRAWQREAVTELIDGHGRIVGEFFDVGCSRRRAWADRPQAVALLAALAEPARGFDAVVVGEYERAFCAHQLRQLVPVLARHGVALWLPEEQGPFDADSPVHRALITLLGARSKHEVLRARFRVRAAMQAQVREQGRFLGGRPPYGYRLVDAGPHPNAAHARWGAGCQGLPNRMPLAPLRKRRRTTVANNPAALSAPDRLGRDFDVGPTGQRWCGDRTCRWEAGG